MTVHGHEARASRPELPAREHEEIADLIERLLGCLEGPALPLQGPLNPHYYQNMTIPLFTNASLAIFIEFRVTSDGRAVQWFMRDPFGSPMKQGLWTLTDKTVAQAVEEQKR